MPQFFNNRLAVTIEELVPAWYNSMNTLNVALFRAKSKDFGITRLRAGGNGRQMLISFDSLPSEIKEGLGDPRKCNHILERFYSTDPKAVAFYSDYQFEDCTYLKSEIQDRYITDASVLNAIILLRCARELERQNKGTKSSLANKPQTIGKTLWNDAVTFNQTLQAKHQVKHCLPESEKRFKECLKAFELNGYTSLISNKHKNQNSRKVDDQTLSLVNSLFAGDKSKPSVIEVYRRYNEFKKGAIMVVNNETSEIYNPKEFPSISDTTVKNYMASWFNKIGNYQLRSSNRQILMQQFKPYHSLLKPEFAGSIISIDDRQPPFKMHNGKRVWFYNAYDLASECFTVWVHGDSKAGIITEFYRQLVRNYAEWGFNMPAELEAEMSLNSSFVNTFLKPGVMFQHVRIEANNARGKFIERVFGKLRYEYEKSKIGWLARPNAASEKNQPAIEIEKVPTLSYETIANNSLQDIENWNNELHSIHTDKTRWEVLTEMQHPDLQPINYKAILPHLGFKTRTSCNAGIIRFNNGEFLLGANGKISTGEYLISLMKMVEGEQIDICWLNNNDGGVLKALIFINDQFICEAISKPRYHRAKIEQTAADLDNREIMSAYVATIEAFGKRRKSLVEPLTIINTTEPKPKTFIMKGLAQPKSIPFGGWQEVEQLAEPAETDYLNPHTQSFVKSLKDNF